MHFAFGAQSVSVFFREQRRILIKCFIKFVQFFNQRNFTIFMVHPVRHCVFKHIFMPHKHANFIFGMSNGVHNDIYDKLISLENILLCWDEFKRGKMKKFDVMEFERNLEDNIFALHRELANQSYKHGAYKEFHVCDPKHRIIHKATVKDRLVHHMVFKELNEIFDPGFIYHSYSSRNNKGTHLAVRNLYCALRKASRNYTKSVYALKCDIKKFFHSVPHQKLFEMMKNRVNDPRFLRLIWEVISSFSIPVVDNFPQRERAK